MWIMRRFVSIVLCCVRACCSLLINHFLLMPPSSHPPQPGTVHTLAGSESHSGDLSNQFKYYVLLSNVMLNNMIISRYWNIIEAATIRGSLYIALCTAVEAGSPQLQMTDMSLFVRHLFVSAHPCPSSRPHNVTCCQYRVQYYIRIRLHTQSAHSHYANIIHCKASTLY